MITSSAAEQGGTLPRNTQGLTILMETADHTAANGLSYSILVGSYNTVEPPNNGQTGDEHFVHCSEVVPSSEVEMYGQYRGRG